MTLTLASHPVLSLLPDSSRRRYGDFRLESFEQQHRILHEYGKVCTPVRCSCGGCNGRPDSRPCQLLPPVSVLCPAPATHEDDRVIIAARIVIEHLDERTTDIKGADG